MKYQVKKSTIEVKVKDWEEGRFYSLDEPWADGNNPEVVGRYDTLEEAEKAAKCMGLAKPRYMSHVIPFYLVEESYIEAVEWDEDFEEWVYVDSCEGYTYLDQEV